MTQLIKGLSLIFLGFQHIILFCGIFICVVGHFLIPFTKTREIAFKISKFCVYFILVFTILTILFSLSLQVTIHIVFYTSFWLIIASVPWAFPEGFGWIGRQWTETKPFGKKILYPSLICLVLSFAIGYLLNL